MGRSLHGYATQPDSTRAAATASASWVIRILSPRVIESFYIFHQPTRIWCLHGLLYFKHARDKRGRPMRSSMKGGVRRRGLASAFHLALRLPPSMLIHWVLRSAPNTKAKKPASHKAHTNLRLSRRPRGHSRNRWAPQRTCSHCSQRTCMHHQHQGPKSVQHRVAQRQASQRQTSTLSGRRARVPLRGRLR